MTESLSNHSHHTARLHHHMKRVREHRAQIDSEAQQAAADHYGRTDTRNEPSGPAGPNSGGKNE